MLGLLHSLIGTVIPNLHIIPTDEDKKTLLVHGPSNMDRPALYRYLITRQSGKTATSFIYIKECITVKQYFIVETHLSQIFLHDKRCFLRKILDDQLILNVLLDILNMCLEISLNHNNSFTNIYCYYVLHFSHYLFP